MDTRFEQKVVKNSEHSGMEGEKSMNILIERMKLYIYRYSIIATRIKLGIYENCKVSF